MGPQQAGMLFLGKENHHFQYEGPEAGSKSSALHQEPTSTQHHLFLAQISNFLSCKTVFCSTEKQPCPSPEGSGEESRVGKCCHLHMASWRWLCQAWEGECREMLLCCPPQTAVTGLNQALGPAQTSITGRRHILDY